MASHTRSMGYGVKASIRPVAASRAFSAAAIRSLGVVNSAMIP
jgi:hypothetical protein